MTITGIRDWRGAVRMACLAAGASAGCWSGASAQQTQFDLSDYLQVAPAWQVWGSNAVRGEHINISGNRGASRFPFDGNHFYDEVDLNFSREFSNTERMTGSVSFLANDSSYRSLHQGGVLERASLTYESGAGPLPLRLRLGDYFGYFSRRTLQRALKGMQSDFFRFGEAGGLNHSVQLIAGTPAATYRSIELDKDLYIGGSWLVDAGNQGQIILNFVRNTREAQGNPTTAQREQDVWSVAGERYFEVAGQALRAEAEIGWFDGDYGAPGSVTRNRRDRGYFAQLEKDRRGDALGWSLRFEDYGADYQPNGGVITPNRRTMEGRLDYRYDSGLVLAARAQQFEDNVDRGVELTTRTFGATLRGPLMPESWSALRGTIDAYVQDRQNQTRTTDDVTQSVTANLSADLTDEWRGRMNVLYRNINSLIAGTAGRVRKEVSLSADYRFDMFRWQGVMTPGLIYRQERGGTSKSDDQGTSLAFVARRADHSIRARYAVEKLDRQGAATDQVSESGSAQYSYTSGPHNFGLDWDFQGIDPLASGAADSHSWRAGAFWRMRFGRPALTRQASFGGAAPVGRTNFVGAENIRLNAALGGLANLPVTGSSPDGLLRVTELQMISALTQRQRLGLLEKGGTIRGAVLVIEFDDVGNLDSNVLTFAKALQAMITRYGTPDRAHQRGAFNANLADDLNAGRFARNYEWDQPDGSVVRLGIPDRQDDQVRIEVQMAQSFPPLRDNRWSIEEIR